MNYKDKIAVIGNGGEWSGYPVVRELGKRGYKVYAFLQKKNSPLCHSKYLRGGKYQIPKKINAQMLKIIIYFCRIKNIKKIICLDEDIKLFIIQNLNLFKDINYAFPSEKSMEIAISKSKSTEFAKNLGIPVPKTLRFTSKEEVKKVEHDFNHPLVIKGEGGVSSSHIRYAHNREQLQKYFDEIYILEKSISSSSPLPHIQEYIGGPTYLSQAIVQNGKTKVVIPHYKFREWPLSGGVSSRAKTIAEPKLVKYMTKMLNALKWHGEAGMEWKYDVERDDFFFMEMNPRFEGSVDLAIKSGVNLPIILVDIIDEIPVPDKIHYNCPVHYRWFYGHDFKCFLHGSYGISTLFRETLNSNIAGEVGINDLSVLRHYWKKPILELVNFMKNK